VIIIDLHFSNFLSFEKKKPRRKKSKIVNFQQLWFNNDERRSALLFLHTSKYYIHTYMQKRNIDKDENLSRLA